MSGRVLVVGAGGREHALAWRLARDPDPPEVLVAPGNDGMGRLFRRLRVPEHDCPGLAEACESEGVDLVVVGPEAPLAAGLADLLAARRIAVYGPRQDGARLESSKWFAKQVMVEAGVPTARAECFDRPEPACAALDRFGPPWVVKADGLAAGKGVCVTGDRGEAESFLADCLRGGRFGDSGRRVLLEEHLQGEELSVMAVCDGERCVLLPAARDYKRAFDGDAGPNTGGMGACAPAATPGSSEEGMVVDAIVRPVLRTMARRGSPYRGTLYCGLMRTSSGLRVVEFNCRFGDPETQAILPLVQGSLTVLLWLAAQGTLAEPVVSARGGATVSVALVDEGYPGRLAGDGWIEGLEEIEAGNETLVFHAATARDGAGWRIAGGRAVYVTAVAETRPAARARVYAAIGRLGGRGWRCRADIGGGVG